MRNTGKYFREAVKFADVEHPKELRQRQQEKLERKIKMEKGEMLPTKRYLGKRTYKARALDFKELDEIEPKSSKVEATSEALREQFDSVYRRGLLEPYNEKRIKKRNTLPAVKYHSNPNQARIDAQAGLTETFGIIGDIGKRK